MLDDLEKGIDAIEKDWETGVNDPAIKDANTKARDYGFKECGQD